MELLRPVSDWIDFHRTDQLTHSQCNRSEATANGPRDTYTCMFGIKIRVLECTKHNLSTNIRSYVKYTQQVTTN